MLRLYKFKFLLKFIVLNFSLLTGLQATPFAPTYGPSQNLLQTHQLQRKGFRLIEFVRYMETGQMDSVPYFMNNFPSLPSKSLDRSWSLGLSHQLQVVRILVQNTTADSSYALLLNNPHVNYSALYLKFPDSTTQFIGQSGDEIPYSARTVKSRDQVFFFNLPKNAMVELFLIVDKRHASVSFPLKLSTYEFYQNAQDSRTLWLGFYFGIIVLVILGSILTSWALKDRIFLDYALLALTVGCYLFINSGLGIQYLYPENTSINMYSAVYLMVLGLLAISNFTIQFFSMNQHHPRATKWFWAMNIIVSLLLFIGHYAGVQGWDYVLVKTLELGYMLILILLMMFIILIIKSYHLHPMETIVYLFAQGSLILGACFKILVQYGVLDESWFFLPPIMLGSLLEILILSGFLIRRIHQLFLQQIEYLSSLAKKKEEIIEAFIEGGERERTEIAGELHDGLGMELVLFRMQLESNGAKDETLSYLDKIFNQLRNISHGISTTNVAKFGLNVALGKMLNQLSANSKLNIQHELFAVGDMNNREAVQLYRIAQEAIKNTNKHAKAQSVFVSLKENEAAITLRIKDDGKGLSTETSSNGFGLSNMETRAQFIKAKLEIHSKPGEGTEIKVIVPTKNRLA